MNKKMTGMGGIYQRGRVYWVWYYHFGKKYQESSKSYDDRVAVRLLKLRLGEIGKGGRPGRDAEKVTFEDLCKMIRDDHQVKGRDVARLERSLQHLTPVFGQSLAMSITRDRIMDYIRQRKEKGASDSTVQKETAALKRMFNLAIQSEKLTWKPYIPSINPQNVRQGFFEEQEFRAVLSHLPEEIRPVAEFGYCTGWRLSEILGLQWRQVDFDGGVVRLDVGSTKNKEGRVFPFSAHPDLAALVLRQRKRIEKIEWAKQKSIPWVFTWSDGRRIRDFRGSWKAACKNAGCSGRIFHDLRRTTVRNMVRAGVAEVVAMRLIGHKTRSIFDRYHIVNEADLAEGVKKLADLNEQLRATRTGKTGTV